MKNNFESYKNKAEEYLAESRARGKFLSDEVKNLKLAVKNYQYALGSSKTDMDENYANEKIKETRSRLRNLEAITGDKFYAFFSFASFILALFFVVNTITGNVTITSASNDFGWLGICFFVCGLVFTFIYFKKGKF